MKKRYGWLIAWVILGTIAGIWGVRRWFAPVPVPEIVEEGGALEPGLTLRDVTLEQQDENGRLVWKVYAQEVTYSPDNEYAQLVRPEGELFQDGVIIYRVSAERGTIRQNGEVILLEDNIRAEGLKNQMLLRGKQLEWFPEQSLLVVRNGLTGTHPQIRAQAEEAHVFNREQRMELRGKVVATTVVEDPRVNPWLKFQGSRLQWQWEKGHLISEQPVRVERFQQQKITEVFAGKKGFVELKTKRITLTEAVQAQLLTIPLNMATEQAIWELEKQTITATKPIKVINPQQKVTVTSQQGVLNLAQKDMLFNQNVLVVSQQNGSQLTANRLTWNFGTQSVLAEGAVNYQQQNPQISVSGERAQGNITAQTVVVDNATAPAGAPRQVVTEIVPN